MSEPSGLLRDIVTGVFTLGGVAVGGWLLPSLLDRSNRRRLMQAVRDELTINLARISFAGAIGAKPQLRTEFLGDALSKPQTTQNPSIYAQLWTVKGLVDHYNRSQSTSSEAERMHPAWSAGRREVQRSILDLLEDMDRFCGTRGIRVDLDSLEKDAVLFRQKCELEDAADEAASRRT